MYSKIKLDDNKEISLKKELIDKSDITYVYIPLFNCGVECKCLVKKGKKVKKDTIIGIREDIDFPILSPVSGTVMGIEKKLYLNNCSVDCIKIKSDFKNKSETYNEVEDINNYSKSKYIELLKRFSITGMGGSDFPTFLKYKNKVRTLIVNAVECEPYITSDYELIMHKASEIVDAIYAIKVINNIDECYIVIKRKNKELYNVLKEYIDFYGNIKIVKVKDYYPAGYEREIVKNILNVNYDKYPSEKNIVVNNISTIYSIYKALKYNTSISKRIVTLSGEMFRTPVNLLLRIGTDMSSVLKRLDGYVRKTKVKLVSGGPMMGYSLEDDNLVVTKNLNCILVIRDIEEYDENPCLKCGRCIEACPMKLSPVSIKENLSNPDELKKLDVNKCMECGLCSYICPAKIDLRSYVRAAKKEVNHK